MGRIATTPGGEFNPMSKPRAKREKKGKAKPKSTKRSRSEIRRRNIQQGKPMNEDVQQVQQVKAKVPGSKVKELATGQGSMRKKDKKLLESSGIMQVGAYLQEDTLPGPAPSESSEIVQQKQSPMAQAAHNKKEHMKQRFLQALEQKFSVARAAKLAGVPRRTVYKWRESDAIFGEEWDDRREGHLDAIEDAMMEGALKMTQSYHAVLALGMLNAHRSELYSPKHRVEHTGAGGGPILLAVAAKIKLMDTEELRGELGKLLGPSLVEVQGPKPES